jgi:hypothetical protein
LSVAAQAVLGVWLVWLLLRAAAGVGVREAHTQKHSFVLIFYQTAFWLLAVWAARRGLPERAQVWRATQEAQRVLALIWWRKAV